VDFDPEGAAIAVVESMGPFGSAERAAQEKRYLKSDLEFLGVSMPDLRRVVRAQARGYPGLGSRDAVAWALALWREPVQERRTAAVEVLTLTSGKLGPDDLAVVERLLRDSRTWALVDPLAVDVVGRIALREPSAWDRIDGWAGDEDFWVRRAALLALLPGVRAGEADLPRFERYAAAMLGEKEFFIRKATGWVAREISKRDPAWVAAWTARHAREMSGVTFREAVRRLPEQEATRLRPLREAAG
jgi:3-methyladenine DNA glycosylase AlkD